MTDLILPVCQIKKQRKESKQSNCSHTGGWSQTRKADSGLSNNARVQANWTVPSSFIPSLNDVPFLTKNITPRIKPGHRKLRAQLYEYSRH